MSIEKTPISATPDESIATSSNTLPISFERVGQVLQRLERHSEQAQEPTRFLAILLEEIAAATRADMALLFGWKEAEKEWILFAHEGMQKDFARNGAIPRAWQSLPSIILQQDGPLFSNDISKDPKFIGQIIRGLGVQTFAGVTLRSGEKIFGSISIGFFKPDILTAEDREVFLLTAKLAAPFLSQTSFAAQLPPALLTPETPSTPPPAVLEEKEKKAPLTFTVDIGGRVIASSEAFIQWLGRTQEETHKIPLSKVLTQEGLSAYGKQVEALRAGRQNLPPLSLEVMKKGERSGSLRARLTLIQKEGRGSAVAVSAEDMTEKETLEKEIFHKNIEISVLESLFTSLSHSFQEGDIFDEVLRKLITLMNVEGAYLLRLDEKNQRLFLLAQRGLTPEKAQRLSKQGIKIGENVIGKVLERRTPTRVVAEDPNVPLKKRWVGEEGLLSYMGAPIQVNGQIAGTLSLFSRIRLFSEDDLRVFGFVVKEIGFAMENMKFFDQARRRVEDLTILNEVSQAITKSLHLDQLLASVASSLTRTIGASNCYIFSMDDKRNVLYGVASDQRSDAIRKVEIKLNENTLAPLTARDRRPFAVENAPQDPRVSKKWIETFKSRSLLSVPLIIKERVIGVILLDETRYFREFTGAEIEKVSALANQVAVAIENATLYQSVTKHMERLQTLSSAIVNIQEEERRRIAQELHDEVGQALTGIKMSLEWLEKELGEGEANVLARIRETTSQVTKTLEGLRRLSYDLRPAILDDLGLVPTLRWYIEDYSKRTKVAVHLQANGTQKRFSPKIEILLYRIIQEALNNVAKHAMAESVVLSLEKKDVHAHLYITDDGKGFEVKKYFSAPPMLRRGLGILGMKERVELAGGTFFIDSDPGQGTRISIKVPIVKRGSHEKG